MRQLPLGVQLAVSLRFDTFVAGANAGAVEALRRLARGASTAPVWVYGPPGAGKSHLLQAACAEAGKGGRSAAYLPLAQLRGEGPRLLDGFDQLGLVALDDLDAVAGDTAFEAALFTLYNGLAEQRGRLAVASAGSPASIAIRLPDLASRLAASEVHRLEPLGEPAQAAALRQRAERRGLELPDETLAFLTRRAPRDFATLCRMLDELDAESLAARRRLTVPFVREWLARG
ncbi:MAG TPA: DnaA regulatory inactivator Hda, partial [Steroidobacteraceae bacterium]|nr:DnaA regulatory inactivator Hda [Steroidobacteraceae bacterium]